MNKKVISVLLVVAMLCTFLSGCMAEEISIKFNSDSSGDVTVGVYFSDEFYEQMEATPEQMFEDEIKDGGKLVKKKINNSTYTGMSETESFKSIDDLNDIIGGDETEDAADFSVTEQYQNNEKVIVVSGRISSDSEIAGDADTIDSDVDLSGLISVTLNLEFTNGVKAVTGLNKDSYTIDGNKININLMSNKNEQYFSITGSLGASTKKSGLQNFVKLANYNNNFKDVPSDAWYAKSVANDYNVGIVAGTSATSFSPNNTLTLAQIITMASRVHAIYNGNGDSRNLFAASQGEAWYQPYVDYAIQNGIIKSTSFKDYNKAATRAEMAYVLSNCLPSSEFKATVEFKEFDDVKTSNPYYNNIKTLYTSGITVGTGGNNFSPDGKLTRAQAAVFIDRLINPSTRGGSK